MISEQDDNPKYTLIVKNFNCAFGIGETVKKTCTGKSYWALRNNSSQHIVWQKYIVASGLGSGLLNRLEPARLNYAKQLIETGLTALSKVDLVVAENKIEERSEQWRTHLNTDSFHNLYDYLLFSSPELVVTDHVYIEGVSLGNRYTKIRAELLHSVTKQYVNDLLGEPDHIDSGTGHNETLVWVLKKEGKEVVYRLFFSQDMLSGGELNGELTGLRM